MAAAGLNGYSGSEPSCLRWKMEIDHIPFHSGLNGNPGPSCVITLVSKNIV